MKKFITPVSMQVTEEQFNRDLRGPLEEFGYIESSCNLVEFDTDGRFNYLITNADNEANRISILCHASKLSYSRHFIDHYNPELFLALAAMTQGDKPIVGEWMFCVEWVGEYATSGKLYKAISSTQVNANIPSVYITHSRWRKATKEELIKHFTKKENMEEKEIIGYKLIKPEYEEAALNITKLQGTSIQYLEELIASYLPNSSTVLDLKEAGVLDLWFEPVYEEPEPEFKVGDKVITEGYSKRYDGKVLTITKIENHRLCYYYYFKESVTKDCCFGMSRIKRYATPEEIERAKEPRIEINGYKAKFSNTYVEFGCQKYSEDFVIKLSECLETNNFKMDYRGQIKEIAEYYKNKYK